MIDNVFSSEAFLQVLKTSPVVRLQPGDRLLQQADPSDAAYFLADGALSISASTRHGLVKLSTVQAPRLVGEIGVLADLPRTANVTAATAAVVHRIDRDRLLLLGQRMPDLLLAVIAQLGRQIATVNSAISLYTQALEALEKRGFDDNILEDLRSPPPQLAEFAAVFQRFVKAIDDKRRRDDEMASAAAIQRSLLPRPDSLLRLAPRFDIAATIRPARDVGGDFYDLIPLADGRAAFALGDVCGKGLPASLFMSVVVSVLRTAAHEHPDAAEAIARANHILCRDNTASMFATAFFGVIDADRGRVDYCNCGHNAPFLLGASGDIRTFPATGLPLALFEDRSARRQTVDLTDGDLLLVFSDGITEALNTEAHEFGEERLAQFLRDVPPTEPAAGVVHRLLEAVDRFAGPAEQFDDMTCIAIRYRAAS